jgi:hypothetical protein
MQTTHQHTIHWKTVNRHHATIGLDRHHDSAFLDVRNSHAIITGDHIPDILDTMHHLVSQMSSLGNIMTDDIISLSDVIAQAKKRIMDVYEWATEHRNPATNAVYTVLPSSIRMNFVIINICNHVQPLSEEDMTDLSTIARLGRYARVFLVIVAHTSQLSSLDNEIIMNTANRIIVGPTNLPSVYALLQGTSSMDTPRQAGILSVYRKEKGFIIPRDDLPWYDRSWKSKGLLAEPASRQDD